MFTTNGYSESSIMYPHLPIFKRFKSACLSYAFSRAFMYVITSFGFILLLEAVGLTLGIILASFFVMILGYYGYQHFLKLEKDRINF